MVLRLPRPSQPLEQSADYAPGRRRRCIWKYLCFKVYTFGLPGTFAWFADGVHHRGPVASE